MPLYRQICSRKMKCLFLVKFPCARVSRHSEGRVLVEMSLDYQYMIGLLLFKTLLGNQVKLRLCIEQWWEEA